MYVERNVFQLKFGSAKQAVTLWKSYLDTAHNADSTIRARLLTDLSGKGYSLVLELIYDAYADLEPSKCRLTQQTGWKEFYRDFIPLCESTERTLYKLETNFS